MPKEEITKLETAKRQMNEAIRLFFERRDIVSVHTLAAASAQVLSDICKARRIGFPLRFDYLVDYIRDEALKEVFGLITRAENFFKHAKSDPEGTLEFETEQTIWMLFDAISLYEKLTNDFTHEGRVFWAWFLLRNPDYMQDGPAKQTLVDYRTSSNIAPDDFAFFARLITEGHGLWPRWATFPRLGNTDGEHG